MGYLHDTSRELIDGDMNGKTVLNASQRASNVIEITFTDGTYLEIWSESGPHGLAIMEVDPNAVKTLDNTNDMR